MAAGEDGDRAQTSRRRCGEMFPLVREASNADRPHGVFDAEDAGLREARIVKFEDQRHEAHRRTRKARIEVGANDSLALVAHLIGKPMPVQEPKIGILRKN